MAFISCSDDQSYDKSKAVLAFSDSDDLKIDENLQSKEIQISKQKSNFEFGQNQKNQTIENYQFTPNGKKFLNKSTDFWSGRKNFKKNRFVFTPIFKDQKAFVLDVSGILSSYDLKTGKQFYKKRLFKRKFIKLYQNPRIGYFNDQIYAVAGTNEIVAANINNGEILWKKKLSSIPVSKPVSDGNLVFVTTNDNKTYAFNAQNGDIAWNSSAVSRPTAIFGSANPILNDKQLIVSYSSGEIYALDKSTGEALWTQSLNINKAIDSDFYLNDIDSTPTIKNNIIYAIGNGGLLMAIDAKSGDYIWQKRIAGIADLWASSGFLFIIDSQDRLIALSQKNGAIKYISQLPAYKNKKKPQSKIIYNGVIMAGDKLIISDMRGRILVANTQNGKIEQEFKVGQEIFHTPIVLDGAIYLHGIDWLTVNLIKIW